MLLKTYYLELLTCQTFGITVIIKSHLFLYLSTGIDWNRIGLYMCACIYNVFFLSSMILQIYNLCIEESYDPSHFHGRVEAYPFDDNHVPPLQMIKTFCESVHSWLSSDPENIAVIHCMVLVAHLAFKFQKAHLSVIFLIICSFHLPCIHLSLIRAKL